VGCHEQEAELFAGSHHDLAMQPANAETVLGDFDDASFTHFGSTSRFFRRDGGYWVTTDGPDGVATDYPIAYTFGVLPLQQYLVPYPGGRLQVLPLCWDTRPVAEGGQRWFHLYPDEAIPAGDVLHWTGPNQTWNFQCAECHSTGLVRNYHPESDDYATTWTEIDVSCEACHGPGAEHLAWAERQQGAESGLVALTEADPAVWVIDEQTGLAARSHPRSSQVQKDTCARCHGRRSLIEARHRFDRSLLDNQVPALLEDALYHADGQPLDEVFVHGSFLQSRMFAAGVTCSDCHDPHALTVRGVGNAACAGCHSPQVFDRPEHHHHDPSGAGAACIDCHMPGTTFMVVDARRDHAFRIPRPDLSAELGTPDACTACHVDRTTEWAAEAALSWWGAERSAQQHYGQVLAAGRRQAIGSGHGLARLVRDEEQSAIVRASALVLLAEQPGGASPDDLARAASASEPLLRLAAARAGDSLAPAERWDTLGGLLDDELLAVRLEAARALAGLSGDGIAAALTTALGRAVDEYRQVQRLDAERPEAQLNLGLLAARLGDWSTAEEAYRRAQRLGPHFQPVAINLSDLYRVLGRDAEGLIVLEQALDLDPTSAQLQHACGLALVRLGRLDEGVLALGKAARAAPEHSRFQYVWAVALGSTGQRERAVETLRLALVDHPGDRDILFALTTYLAEGGELVEALVSARLLSVLAPDDAAVNKLVAQLQADAAADR
jgi:Flp pilus assembly protein TadD